MIITVLISKLIFQIHSLQHLKSESKLYRCHSQIIFLRYEERSRAYVKMIAIDLSMRMESLSLKTKVGFMIH